MTVSAYKQWVYLGASVRGSRHYKTGQPNQDALISGSLPGDAGAFAAISDGHGSSTCFRSEIGATTAVTVVDELIRTRRLMTMIYEFDGMQRVADEILQHWRRNILSHLKQYPFTLDETAALDRQQRMIIGRNALVAYGATLLMVCAMDREAFFFQLGDGDFLTLDGTGAVCGVFPPDDRLMGNATTSLCMPNALQEFRYSHWRNPMPKMLMGSSDGYGNSFRSQADFHKALRDYDRLIIDHGWEKVSQKLPEWLSETSAHGSGDDISVAILFRP